MLGWRRGLRRVLCCAAGRSALDICLLEICSCRDRACQPGTTTRETLVYIHFLATGGDRLLRPHVIDHWYEVIRNVTHVLPEKKSALNCHGPGTGNYFIGSRKVARRRGVW